MELRKSRRVVFDRGYPAHMMAIDGTWRRTCMMEDASDSGARLTVEGSIEGPGPNGVLPAAFIYRPRVPPLPIGVG
jgi:hypothetical protein